MTREAVGFVTVAGELVVVFCALGLLVQFFRSLGLLKRQREQIERVDALLDELVEHQAQVAAQKAPFRPLLPFPTACRASAERDPGPIPHRLSAFKIVTHTVGPGTKGSLFTPSPPPVTAQTIKSGAVRAEDIRTGFGDRQPGL